MIRQFQAQITTPLTETFDFKNMGLSTTTIPGTLSFCTNRRFLAEILGNPNISSLFLAPDIDRAEIPDHIPCVVVSDPSAVFYAVYAQWVARLPKFNVRTRIAETAKIHPTAVISDHNVVIEDSVEIGPYVVILDHVSIGEGTKIASHTVIGNQGFIVKSIEGAPNRRLHHLGHVRIGRYVDIGSHCAIDLGCFGEATMIDDYVAIDNLCHIAHEVHIGSNSIITAGAVFAGRVDLKTHVWIGPNATLCNQVVVGDHGKVTIGSMAVDSVPANETVTGFWAQPHQQFKRRYLGLFRDQVKK